MDNKIHVTIVVASGIVSEVYSTLGCIEVTIIDRDNDQGEQVIPVSPVIPWLDNTSFIAYLLADNS